MKRFLPYLRYLRGRRMALILALVCGAVSGLVYGFGLPKVMNEVFPKIFTNAAGQPDDIPLLKPGTPSASRSLNAVSPASSPIPAEQLAAKERVRAGRTLSTRQIVGYALLIPFIFLIRAVSGFLNNYLMSYCGIGVLEALRVELYRKLQHLPLSYFGRNRTGDLLSRLTSDTQVVQQTITSSASDLVIQPVTLIGAIYFLAERALKKEKQALAV